MASLEHKRSRLVLLVANAASLLLTILWNALANENTLPGVFLSDIGTVSDKYYLSITPAGWTFSIWAVIYIAQLAFVSYVLSLICRKGPKNYLYLSPDGMIPNIVYICYIFANLGNIAWVFLWDRELIVASGILIALIAAALLIATAYSLVGLHVTSPQLKKSNLQREIWLNRILVQNAIGIYTTWVCIATLLNLAMILTYVLGIPEHEASTVSLGILCAELVIWFILDIFVIYRDSNYLIIPYTVVIVALSGSIDRNFVAWTRNSLFSVILLIIAVAAFLVKVITMLYRHIMMANDQHAEAQKQGKE